MNKTPQRRYVKFEFFGYAPIDLAIQLHLLGKKTDVNIVGDDMQPYTEYLEDYDKLHKPEVSQCDLSQKNKKEVRHSSHD